ncbi:MAG TPA: sulfite exporter TauE/SafE family protein [Burkholderiales bacterium]|nr:sulfite exporter TauE/SafE family protein [Burkholderiales bacterium]
MILETASGSWGFAWSVLGVFAGYALRGATGFGAGLIIVPALAFVMPFEVVVPLLSAMGIFASSGQAWHQRRHLDATSRKALVALLGWSMVGVALGLMLFAVLASRLLLNLFGVFLAAYALWSLRPHAPPRAAPRRGVIAASGISGSIVATLFGGMAGPFFAVYLDALRLGRARFRATMSTVLFLLSIVRVAGYGGLGLYDARVGALLVVLMPVMVVGMVAGERLHHRLSEVRFQKVVAVLLVLSGIALALK